MRTTSALSRPYISFCALLLAAIAIGASVSAIKDKAKRDAVAEALTGGDQSRAPALFRRYGCGGCHTIPGIPGADGKVGGSLSGLRERVYVAGVANNTPQNLVDWIVSPQRFSAHTAMPPTGISEAEARDLAAYIYAR